MADIDEDLEKELRAKKPIPIVIEFSDKPRTEEIEKLKDIGISINAVFKVSPLVSATANPEQIKQMRGLPYLRKIWLDSMVEIC